MKPGRTYVDVVYMLIKQYLKGVGQKNPSKKTEKDIKCTKIENISDGGRTPCSNRKGGSLLFGFEGETRELRENLLAGILHVQKSCMIDTKPNYISRIKEWKKD